MKTHPVYAITYNANKVEVDGFFNAVPAVISATDQSTLIATFDYICKSSVKLLLLQYHIL